MSDAVLEQIRAIIQRDVNNRGLATYARENLFTYCESDFEAACRNMAGTESPFVSIVMGFYIAKADAGEADGPIGTMFLAQVLCALGPAVRILVEPFALPASEMALLRAGLMLGDRIEVVPLSAPKKNCAIWQNSPLLHRKPRLAASGSNLVTHVVAIERAGPSHGPTSLRKQERTGPAPLEQFEARVAKDHFYKHHNMRGEIITKSLSPSHRVFDYLKSQAVPITTIGIGDGGNEIGMGKIPWEV